MQEVTRCDHNFNFNGIYIRSIRNYFRLIACLFAEIKSVKWVAKMKDSRSSIQRPRNKDLTQLRIVVRQFILFAGVGIVGTAGHYVILVALVEILSFDPVVASGVGFAGGAMINYYLNRSYTFESVVPHLIGLPKFLGVAAVGMLINTAIMAAAITFMQLHYILAQIIATGLVLIWNFLGNKYWTFAD